MRSSRTSIKHGLHFNTASLTLAVGVHHEHWQNRTNLVWLKTNPGAGFWERPCATARLRHHQTVRCSPWPRSTALHWTVTEAAHYTDCKQLFLPFTPATTDQTCCWRICHITADLCVCSVSTGLLQLTISRSTTHLRRTITTSTERSWSTGA